MYEEVKLRLGSCIKYCVKQRTPTVLHSKIYKVFEKDLPSVMYKLNGEIKEKLHRRVHTIKENPVKFFKIKKYLFYQQNL